MSMRGKSFTSQSRNLFCWLILMVFMAIQGLAWPIAAEASMVTDLNVGYITTVAGSSASGNSGNGGPATSAKFKYIYGITVDASGNLYIADTNSHVIRKVGTDGMISSVAGTGSLGYSVDGTIATSAKLNKPYDIALDSAGNLYFSDQYNNRIRVVSAITGTLYGVSVTAGNIYTIAGSTGTAGFAGEDGTSALDAKLAYPQGIALDAVGNLYFSDFQNNRVRKIDTSGNIWTVAGNGSPGTAETIENVAATSTNLTPGVLTIDSAGQLYVASQYRIFKINSHGIISCVAGTGDIGYNGDGIAATTAQIKSPLGLDVDAAGNIYIAEGNRIRKVNSEGQIMSIVGDGTSANAGDGGLAVNAQVKATGLACDTEGNLYIGAQTKVRYVQLAQTQSTPPALTADSTDNKVGQDIIVSFTETDNGAWRNAINEISIDGSALESTKYTTTTAGAITIDKSVFATDKDYVIVVKAAGYTDASISQNLTAVPIAAPALTIGNSSGAPNAVVQIPVTLTSSGEVVGLQFDFSYDHTQLTYQQIAAGSLTSNFTLSTNAVGDKLRVIIYNANNTPITSGSGTVAQLQFQIAAGAQAGQTSTLELGGVILADAQGQSVETTVSNGQFLVSEAGHGTDPTPVLASLALSGAPSLTYNSTPLNLDLSTLTLAGMDATGGNVDLSGQTVMWTIVPGSSSASIADHTLTISASGTVTVTASIGSITSNPLALIINSGYATNSLIIKVNGGAPITVTSDQINALNPDNTLRAYSTYKNGSASYYTGLGAPLKDILSTYASLDSAQIQGILVIGSDDYQTPITDPQNQLFAPRSYYPANGGSAQLVDTIIATKAQGYCTTDPSLLDTVNTLRLLMGQTSSTERTNNLMAKWVKEIDITTLSANLNPPNLTTYTLTVGQPVCLSFSDNPNWRAAISSIIVDDTILDSTKYNTTTAGAVTIDKSVFTNAKGYVILVKATGYTDASVTQTMTNPAASEPPVYTLTPTTDSAYTNGATPDGIKTMTVNSGINGLKYFVVSISPVKAHDGQETVVFVHLRNGLQLELNATKADLDMVNTAAAGFNVLEGDLIKVYVIDNLTNSVDFNPTIFQ